MNPITAVAMHRRALGSTLFDFDAAAEPLGGRVAVEHRPLPGAVDRHRVRARLVQRLLVLPGDQVERLVPRDALPAVAVPEHRVLQPVLAVQHAGQVVALHAQQAPVDRALLVAAHGDDLAVPDPDLDAAAGAAVAAGRLAPREIGLVESVAAAGEAARRVPVRAREGGEAGGRGSNGLEEVSASHDESSLFSFSVRHRTGAPFPRGCGRLPPRRPSSNHTCSGRARISSMTARRRRLRGLPVSRACSTISRACGISSM